MDEAATRRFKQHVVYVDFAGAMCAGDLHADLGRVRAAILTGGVHTHVRPLPVDEHTNRLAYATTHQMYNAAHTHAWLQTIAREGTLLVTLTHGAMRGRRTERPFLRANGLTGGVLEPILAAHHDMVGREEEPSVGLYAARVLRGLFDGGTLPPTEARYCHCDEVYGLTLVSAHADARAAVEEAGRFVVPEELERMRACAFATAPVCDLPRDAPANTPCGRAE